MESCHGFAGIKKPIGWIKYCPKWKQCLFASLWWRGKFRIQKVSSNARIHFNGQQHKLEAYITSLSCRSLACMFQYSWHLVARRDVFKPKRPFCFICHKNEHRISHFKADFTDFATYLWKRVLFSTCSMCNCRCVMNKWYSRYDVHTGTCRWLCLKENYPLA